MSAPADALRWVRGVLEPRLAPDQARWFARASGEVAAGASNEQLCALISKASRQLPRGPLAPTADERQAAGELVPERCDRLGSGLAGVDPERWTVLEAGRVALVLAHPGCGDERIERALEEAFRYSEVGEQCALYRSLVLLPDAGRFVRRAGEGARSNMRSVFEATCCDTPYAALWFDDVAWRSAVIKCLFVEAPLWRLTGVDLRIDADLAHTALDLADERRSAGRAVYPELWMCLGRAGGERGLASLARELEEGPPRGRAGAALGLARAGAAEAAGRLEALAAGDPDRLVREVAAAALAGAHDQRAFRRLEG